MALKETQCQAMAEEKLSANSFKPQWKRTAASRHVLEKRKLRELLDEVDDRRQEIQDYTDDNDDASWEGFQQYFKRKYADFADEQELLKWLEYFKAIYEQETGQNDVN